MRALGLGALLLLSGCAAFDAHHCAAGLHPAEIAELFFGRNTGASEGVSDAAWQSFVADEIAPRFPDGFTIGDASGQWRGDDGAIAAERSKRVLIVLSGAPAQQASLDAIRAAYVARFHQDSVLLVETQSCAGF